MIKFGCPARLICAIILLLVTAIHSYSQSPLQINCGNLHLAIPDFKADTVQSFTNEYVKDSILSSITASDADVEIRLYMPHNSLLQFYRIQCKNNKIKTFSFTAGIYYGTPHNFSVAPGYVKFLRTLTKVKGDFAKQNVVCLMNYRPVVHVLNHSLPADSALQELINNHIFLLPDISAIITNLQNQNISCNEPSHFENMSAFVIEVKLHNQYRNFRVGPGYFKNNETKEEFKNGYELVHLIRYIITNAENWQCENILCP